VETGPILHYLSAERDILSHDESGRSQGNGILMLGGPISDAGRKGLLALAGGAVSPSDSSLDVSP
jgi:hypothetical protein